MVHKIQPALKLACSDALDLGHRSPGHPGRQPRGGPPGDRSASTSFSSVGGSRGGSRLVERDPTPLKRVWPVLLPVLTGLVLNGLYAGKLLSR